MKTLAVVLLTTFVVGCTTVAEKVVPEFVPSLTYCDSLDYSRRGKDFAVQAMCKLP